MLETTAMVRNDDAARVDGAVLSLSDLLRALPDRLGSDEASIGELIDLLAPKSYPLVMLLLAIPNLIPVPAPGLSAVVGLPLAALMLQMSLGYRKPILPRFLARRKISLPQLRAACRRAIPYAERLEALIRPRCSFMLRSAVDRFIGLAALLLSLIIMLPIPFGNALPALAICIIAVGLLRGDGLTILAGLGVAAAELVFLALFAGVLTTLASKILRI
jgi:hypothetical protein